MASFLQSATKAIKNTFVNLSLVIISLLICFILLELGFRLAGYQAIYDTYSKSSLLWQYDALLGWSHKPGSDGVYTGPRPWPVEYSSPIHINSNGLRGQEVGSKEGLRILMLGDSVTAGFEVRNEETYAVQVQEMLSQQLNRKVQVINAGVRGYGTDQSYLYYKERGKKLQADIVLFLHIANDPLNNITLHRMRRPFGKPAFQIVSENNQQQLKLTGFPTPEYTLCSEYQLGKNYQIEKIDTPFNRMTCWVQMKFTDYSAFFTYLAFKIRQHPDLLRKLYFAGSPEKKPDKAAEDYNSQEIAEDTSQKALSSKHTPLKSTAIKSVATLDTTQQARPMQQPDKPVNSKPPIVNALPAPDQLTSLIIKQLAQTVKENNGHFILLTSADHSPFLVDQHSLLKEGVDIISIGSLNEENDPSNPYIFNNDPHWTSAGHRAFAEKLAPQLIKRISPQTGKD